MPAQSQKVATHRALASARRHDLLDALRSARRPLDADEAAAAVGLARNTARVHLGVLVAGGLVIRRREERSVPGRPRVLYEVARPAPTVGHEAHAEINYRDLARLLADQLGGAAPSRRALVQRAGRAWAETQGLDALPRRRMSPRRAAEVLESILNDLGFDPELDPGRAPQRILLHRCPFEDVAREHRDVVCAVHLAMLQSTAERLNSALSVSALHPFVSDEPLTCHVRLEMNQSGAVATPTRRRSERP